MRPANKRKAASAKGGPAKGNLAKTKRLYRCSPQLASEIDRAVANLNWISGQVAFTIGELEDEQIHFGQAWADVDRVRSRVARVISLLTRLREAAR